MEAIFMKKVAISLSEWCQQKGKPQLLILYDCEQNSFPPSEIHFPSAKKKYRFRCPECNNQWEQTTNQFTRLKAGSYNIIKKRPELTFCPYCRGERLSLQYNLATEFPEILGRWDYDRNTESPRKYLPSTHRKFYLKCPNCKYPLPTSCLYQRSPRSASLSSLWVWKTARSDIFQLPKDSLSQYCR